MEPALKKTRWIWQALGFYTALVVFCTVLLVIVAAMRGERVPSSGADQAFTSFLGQLPTPTLPAGELIPAHAPSLGPTNAAVTIVEFGDFQCPYCRAAVYPVRQLLQRYPNDVRLVFRQFPVSALHPLAERLALASLCAHDQGLFWPFHDQIYARQEALTETSIDTIAQSVGVDMQRFGVCLSSRQFQKHVDQDFADAVRLGGRGTPTWIVNGQKIEGALPFEAWVQIVEGLIK